jgi:hypothetical protein
MHSPEMAQRSSQKNSTINAHNESRLTVWLLGTAKAANNQLPGETQLAVCLLYSAALNAAQR